MSGKHSLLPSLAIICVTCDTTLWHYYFRSGSSKTTKRETETSKKTAGKVAYAKRFGSKATLRNKFLSYLRLQMFGGAPEKKNVRRVLFQPSNYIHVKLVFTAKRSCRKEEKEHKTLNYVAEDRLPKIFASRVHCCGGFDSFDWQLNEAARNYKSLKNLTTHQLKPTLPVRYKEFSCSRQLKRVARLPQSTQHWTLRGLTVRWRNLRGRFRRKNNL